MMSIFSQFLKAKFTRVAMVAMLLSAVSCTKPNNNNSYLLSVKLKNSVFITNEGMFTNNNSALSVYDTVERRMISNVYYDVNGTSEGDVMQSMSIIDGRGYLVINNSGKVIVIDTSTCKHLGKIIELVSPRYIESINKNKLYISSLESPEIAIVNPNTLKITGHIHVGAPTEQIVRLNDNIYACSWSYNNKLYKIDTRTDRVVDSMIVPKQPNSMVLDSRNQLWILSDGGYPGIPGGEELGALTLVDPVQMSIVRQMNFPNLAAAPSRLNINAGGNMLYFLDNRYGSSSSTEGGVFRLSTNDTQLPNEPFLAQQKRLFYGLGIDPHNGEIYLTDAIDFAQDGLMMRYSADGQTLIDTKTTKINPGSFCF